MEMRPDPAHADHGRRREWVKRRMGEWVNGEIGELEVWRIGETAKGAKGAKIAKGGGSKFSYSPHSPHSPVLQFTHSPIIRFSNSPRRSSTVSLGVEDDCRQGGDWRAGFFRFRFWQSSDDRRWRGATPGALRLQAPFERSGGERHSFPTGTSCRRASPAATYQDSPWPHAQNQARESPRLTIIVYDKEPKR